MKMRKLIISTVCAIILGTMGSMSVQAATTDYSVTGTSVSLEEIEPRADIIEIMYRKTPEGKLQYRRWNQTKGYWVDPYWIDI